MKTKSKFKIITAVIVLVLFGGLVGGYLALVHVPDWYQPAYVGVADQQCLRDDLTSMTTKFNNSMQHPDAFEFSITEDEINRLLSGLGYLDPRLSEAIPTSVDRPAVQLDDDTLKLGAVIEQDGRKVFASFRIKVSALEDILVMDNLEAYVGMYPIPRETLKEKMSKVSGRLAKYSPVIEEMLNAGRCPNRFPYPNSSYDFRIRDLKARDGVLSMTVQPITRTKTKK
jgi:hypothetical protein